jgi:hypothetical protein
MSTNDFEVHPRGTADELRLSRELMEAMRVEMESFGKGLFPHAVTQAYNRLYGQYIRQIQSEQL